MALDSTFKTGNLGLVLGLYRQGITSSHGGSIGVGIVVDDVLVLGWGTIEVTGVVLLLLA